MPDRGACKCAKAPNPLKKKCSQACLEAACQLFAQTVANVHRAAKETRAKTREILQKKFCGARCTATNDSAWRYVNASSAKIHPRASPLRRHVPWTRGLCPRRRARPHAAASQLVGHIHCRGH